MEMRALLLPLLLSFSLEILAAQESDLAEWPEVRVPKENWQQAAAMSKSPEWARWLAAREAQTQSWMASSSEDATRSVGWLHDYIDVSSGRFLQWTPGTAPPPDPASKIHGAWRANVRINNFAQILEAARLYRLTQNKVYLEWVRKQLDDYAANYAALPLLKRNRASKLFGQGLDEAVYAFPLLEAVRLVRADVSNDELERWRDKLFIPMGEVLKQSIKDDDNVTIWIVAAMAAIADEFKLTEMSDYALKSEQGLKRILARGTSEDNFWHEMSLQYQDYAVRALANWLYSAGIHLKSPNDPDAQAFKQIGTLTRALMLAPLTLRFSEMDAPALNDTQGLRKIPNLELWGSVWRVLPTPAGLAAAKASKSWDSLLDPPPATIPNAPLPPVETAILKGLDSVLLYRLGWQALIRYGQKIPGHAHQEALSYDLKFENSWLFRDPGTVGYGSPLHTNFYKRAHAHTAPLIDRDGQLPWPSQGKVAAFDKNTAAVKVEHDSYSRGHYVSRELRIEPDGFSDTVEFNLRRGVPKPLGLTFNTACVPTYPAVTAQAEDTLKQTGPFQYWTQRAQYAVNNRLDITLDCAGKRFQMRIEGADLQTLFTARTPATGKMPNFGFYLETAPVVNSVIKLRIQATTK